MREGNIFMSSLFLCKCEGSLRPIQLITTMFYDKEPNIGKSLYYDFDNGNILTRYFEISIKKGKKLESMVMQDAPYEYDLSEILCLPNNNKFNIAEISNKELLTEIKEKLTFTPNEIKRLNEYRFGITKKR